MFGKPEAGLVTIAKGKEIEATFPIMRSDIVSDFTICYVRLLRMFSSYLL